jgi:hypothetical protein
MWLVKIEFRGAVAELGDHLGPVMSTRKDAFLMTHEFNTVSILKSEIITK